MSSEDASVPLAVEAAGASIAEAIDAIVSRLEAGGRLIYVGAGTSGRLALVDAVECESTFAVPPGLVVALVAGGATSAATAQEHAEDDDVAGAAEIAALDSGSLDAVVGLSASGRTPYVVGALAAARSAGALTVALVAVPDSELGSSADHEIAVVVGPEVIAGSTRLKAGTAQKLVLNMISTIAMVRLGKTYGNLMVDVVATNDKLRARVQRIVMQATGADRESVDAALADSGGDAKVAIVTLLSGVDVAEAQRRLAAAHGVVRKALATVRLGVQACLVDGRLELGDCAVEDGVVVAVGLEGGSRGVAVPGFVDLQVNGFAGVDFLGADADGYARPQTRCSRRASPHSSRRSSPPSEADLVAALQAVPRRARGPRILGAHLEGPFLSAARLGTHPGRYRCDPDLDCSSDSSPAGPVTMMTLAPELPGALDSSTSSWLAASSSRSATRTRRRSRRTPPSTGECAR